MTDAVLYEVRGRVAAVTLSRPDRIDAWNPAMHRGHLDSRDRAAADPGVRMKRPPDFAPYAGARCTP